MVAASLLLLWPCLFGGRILLPLDLLPVMGPFRAHPERFPDWPGHPYNPLLDPVQQYWPWRLFACKWLLRGEIPLWNPHAFSGYPFLANLQSALLYPFNLLFLSFAARGATEEGFGWSALLHLLLGCAWAYFLFRRWRISPAGACLGALAFSFSGWRMAWLEYPTVSMWVMTWLPACWLAVDYVCRRPSLAGMWGLALAVAFALLGGHLQMAAYVLFSSGAYALFLLLSRRRGRREISFLLSGIVLGFALSLPQLLPTLELTWNSPRAGAVPLREVLKSAVPANEVGRLLVPNLLGHPADYNYIGSFNYLETCGYAGSLTLLLAVLTLRRGMPSPVYFLLGLEGFVLLCAFGSYAYALLWPLLPGLTAPGRLFPVHAFLLGALAGFGLDSVLKEGKVPWRHILGASVVAALLVGYTAGTHREALLETGLIAYARAEALKAAMWWAVGCVLLCAMRWRGTLRWAFPLLLAVDLVGFGKKFNPMPPASYARVRPECVEHLRAEGGVVPRLISVGTNFLDWFAANLPMVYELHDFNGSDSLLLARYVNLLKRLYGEPLEPWKFRRFDSPLLDLFNVRYVLSSIPLDHPALRLWALSDMRIYERPSAFPRAYVARRVWTFTDEKAICNWMLEGRPSRLDVALLSPHRARGTEGRAHIVRYEPNRVEVLCRAKGEGLLVLSDVMYPGWRACVGGREVHLLRANLLMRAVEIPGGESRVTFVFHPASFSCGLFVALLGLALLSGSLCFRRLATW